VVVVSIAYRLGPLGFLSHPSLDNVADQPVSNFGLLDIEQAFMWVQQNIAAFGGDPGNITGFGESAGAGNLVVLALAGTDQEQVFRRIIAQSTGGSADRLISLADQQALGEKLAIGLGAPVDASAQELRALPAQALVDASDTVLDGYYFSPAIDGLTIKTQPLEALRAGHGKDLELMIGTNADEMYMYIDAASGAEELDTWIMDTAPEFAGSLHAALEDETDPRRALDRLQTAKDTLCPSRYTAALVSAQGGQGFVYYFSLARQGEGGELLGAYHGTELPYVFNKHDSWLPTGQDDLALTEVMLDYWASFAATGSPQATNQPGWPVFTDSRKYVMELGSQVSIVEPQDEVLCRYLGPRKQ
jgi:para-nitrobenzyl esterase